VIGDWWLVVGEEDGGRGQGFSLVAATVPGRKCGLWNAECGMGTRYQRRLSFTTTLRPGPELLNEGIGSVKP
jgi:hypothetical protein